MTEEVFWGLGRVNLLADPNRLFKLLMNEDTKNNIESFRVKKVKELMK